MSLAEEILKDDVEQKISMISLPSEHNNYQVTYIIDHHPKREHQQLPPDSTTSSLIDSIKDSAKTNLGKLLENIDSAECTTNAAVALASAVVKRRAPSPYWGGGGSASAAAAVAVQRRMSPPVTSFLKQPHSSFKPAQAKE